MQRNAGKSQPDRERDPRLVTARWASGPLLVALVGVMLSLGSHSQAQQNTQTLPPTMYDPLQWPPVNNPANPKISVDRKLQEDPFKTPENQKRIAALNQLRKKEMTSDTAKLVALASALKVEANHPSANGLTLDELEKAEEIAKLAHGVHEKMITIVAR